MTDDSSGRRPAGKNRIMTDELTPPWPELARAIRERTPARIFAGRAGSSYPTAAQLDLREAHAAAADAVHHDLDLTAALGARFCESHKLFEISTIATSKAEFLLRPDLGRRLSGEACSIIKDRCRPNVDLQIAIGDGLSVAAVSSQVPQLLPLLVHTASRRGLHLGQPFAIRHCRVGVMNDIGELLSPMVTVLLIGERPGLATAESLSAYVAYKPDRAHSDADRNLVSNIHARGTPPLEASIRILDLVAAMMSHQISGTKLSPDW
ncbi:MAG TPA: ethanolamine ammonia-lyase subunit EutC, partial [Lacipirellulaceae bacterium]|nr:ethanolamine ammonia-lyase subunit EutC [Lacipirellulaceae bacterium]